MIKGSTSVPLRSRNITFQAATHVDAEKIAKLIQNAIGNSFKRAGQMVTNIVASSTLPNTPQTRFDSRKPGRLKPNKGQVKKLQERIKRNLLGTGNPNNAIPDDKGQPVFAGKNGAEITSAAPVFVERKYRSKVKGRKINKPDRLLGKEEVIRHIIEGTEFSTKKGAAMRYKKHGHKYAWTTKANLKAAVNHFTKRAGNFLFGWNELSKSVGSAAIKNGTVSGGLYDSPGGAGSFMSNVASESFNMRGSDNNVPGDKHKYLNSYIAQNLGKWVNASVQSSLRQVNPNNIKKLSGIKDMQNVKIMWDK